MERTAKTTSAMRSAPAGVALLLVGALLPAWCSHARADAVQIRLADGETLTGELIDFSLQHGAELAIGRDESVDVETRDIVSISPVAAAAEPIAAGTAVMLTNDDVLYGSLEQADDGFLQLATADAGPIRIPLERVQRVVLPGVDAEPVSADFGSAGSLDSDRILFKNGDELRGFVVALCADIIEIESSLGPMRVDLKLVAQVTLANPRAESTGEKLQAVIHWVESGRLTVDALHWMPDRVTLAQDDAAESSGKPDRIARVDILGGRWRWLSRMDPTSYQQTSMLTTGWGFAKDRNVLGAPLSVAGREFDNGLGVHSRSILSYDLRGEYRHFVTAFGLDDRTGPYADVSVFIHVDGDRRFELMDVRPGKLHGPVRINVEHAKRLELICDFGRNVDLQDRFDWIEPALIR